MKTFSSFYQLWVELQRRFGQIPGQAYLWLAIFIFGASNSVTQKLTDLGAQHFIDGRNPISLCNVLFVGNLCALLVLGIIYRQQCRPALLKQLSLAEWIYLTAVAVLAGALAPALIFTALSLTSVNNVVLIGRLEPPLVLGLSIWWLGERVDRWQLIGAIVSFIGVVLTVLLQSKLMGSAFGINLHLGVGETLVAGGAIALAIATVLSKYKLQRLPGGLYTIVRTALGTLVFFILALLLYGPVHFMDVFIPFLWKWMLVYGALIVVAGQCFWFTGLKSSTVSQVSLAGAFTPIAGMLMAYLILGEVPNLAQILGGIVILLGIGLFQWGIWQRGQQQAFRIIDTGQLQQQENQTGFRGI